MAETTVESNQKLLERAYDAFNEGDIETVTSVMADDIEWIEPDGLAISGTHRGPDAVVEDVFGPTMEQFGEIELVVDRFVDGGDTIVALGTSHATARATGTELRNPFAHVFDIEDGQITRFVQYMNPYLWRAAVEA